MDSEERPLTKKERKRLKKLEKQQKREQERRKNLVIRTAVWLLVFLGLGASIWGVVKLARTSPQSATLAGEVSESDQTKGNKDAEVVLVEYSDFQCPACGRVFPLLKQLNEEFGDRVLFVYRHFPLRQTHRNAEAAAKAAEAAGVQGKFWEMHDLLFENQSEWSDQRSVEDTWLKYAQGLGLDLEQFKDDLRSKEVKEKVENDYLGGTRSQVNGTPTFFLNGKKIRNPRDLNEFRRVLNQALEQGGERK